MIVQTKDLDVLVRELLFIWLELVDSYRYRMLVDGQRIQAEFVTLKIRIQQVFGRTQFNKFGHFYRQYGMFNKNNITVRLRNVVLTLTVQKCRKSLKSGMWKLI